MVKNKCLLFCTKELSRGISELGSQLLSEQWKNLQKLQSVKNTEDVEISLIQQTLTESKIASLKSNIDELQIQASKPFFDSEQRGSFDICSKSIQFNFQLVCPQVGMTYIKSWLYLLKVILLFKL